MVAHNESVASPNSDSDSNLNLKSFSGGQRVRSAVKIVLVVYTLLAVMLGFFQRKLLYHPSTAKKLPIASDRELMKLFPASKDLRIKCSDGTEIGAWWLNHQETAPTKPNGTTDDVAAATATDHREASEAAQNGSRRPLILYFHGNANHRGSRGPWYQLFAAVGADVLAIDYHGYGDSGGSMSEGGMYQDCDAAWAYATQELNYAPSEIIIAGTSLGGAAAVYTAFKQKDETQQPAALVVTATFSSMLDVARSLYPWLPVTAILVDRYPSAERIPEIKCPIVIMHGDQDRLVYTKHGQKLFDLAPARSQSGHPKRWVTLAGIGHNGLVRLAGKQIQKEFQTVVNQLNQR